MTTTHDTAAAIIRTLIRAIDDQDYDTIAALLTPDVHFRLGNSDPTDLRSDFLDAAKTFRGTIADQRHTILNVWDPASAVDGHMIASDLGRDLRRRC